MFCVRHIDGKRGYNGSSRAVLGGFLAVLLMVCFTAGAHTLPISYLRLVADREYLHLELIFNPFELTFVSEVDDDKDGELSVGEIKKHGERIATRISRSLRILMAGKVVTPENAGMDPDMSGHHVRLRVHYKADAREAPIALISEMQSITSASHLTQVSFSNGRLVQLGQMDSRSVKVAFNNPAPRETKAEATARSRDAQTHE